MNYFIFRILVMLKPFFARISACCLQSTRVKIVFGFFWAKPPEKNKRKNKHKNNAFSTIEYARQPSLCTSFFSAQGDITDKVRAPAPAIGYRIT